MMSSIDEISHKHIARMWYLSTYFEQFEYIEKLSMYIAAYRYGGVDGLHVGFFHEDLFHLQRER